MKSEISVFTGIISLPDLLVFENAKQPYDDFMHRTSLRNALESIYQFCKDFDMIIM